MLTEPHEVQLTQLTEPHEVQLTQLTEPQEVNCVNTVKIMRLTVLTQLKS